MKRRILLSFLLSFGCTSILLSSCGESSTSFTSSSSQQESTSQTSSSSSSTLSYDENWTPGDEALLDATQPTIKNPSGDYSAPINKLRASNQKEGLPSKGQANILVAPIQFKDDDLSSMASEIVYKDPDLYNLNQAYFGQDNSYPSVSEYYDYMSNSSLKLSGVITPIVTLEEDYSYYLNIIGNATDTKESLYTQILNYVYNYLFVETKTYYDQDFDSNDDGKVDGIVLAYDWPSFKSDTGYQMQSSSDQAIVEEFFNSDTYFYKDIKEYNELLQVNSFTFTSGKYISSYYLDSSDNATYGTNDSHEFIKQVGRMMGLEDYSDRVGKTINGSTVYRAPLGNLDMMEVGVGELNPFDLYQLGYIEPQKVFTNNFSTTQTIELTEENNTLLLGYKDTGIYGEYLLIQLYDGTTDINSKDSSSPYYLNYSAVSDIGIKVYKVDSRLVRGINEFELFEDEVDYSKTGLDAKGNQVKYSYDYAFTNDYDNKYAEQGIVFEFPILELLKKDESNRHAVNKLFSYTSSDLFKEGDVFGDSSSSTGFYRSFKFDGDGYSRDTLGVSFKVTSLSSSNATITIERI